MAFPPTDEVAERLGETKLGLTFEAHNNSANGANPDQEIVQPAKSGRS
jgi:hypothetical protein